MRIALATPTLIEGDAVGNDVLGMCRTLLDAGHQVRLFADRSKVTMPCDPIRSLRETDIFIYHHSIGCESGVPGTNWS